MEEIIMKIRKISFLLGLFFLAHFCTCFAGEHFMSESMEIKNSIKSESERIYVAPDMVYIASDGIFINFQGNIIAVNSISNDVNGIYFSLSDYECRYDQDWPCPRCGWINNGDRANCVKCNKRNPNL
jgi:hypothetical protein